MIKAILLLCLMSACVDDGELASTPDAAVEVTAVSGQLVPYSAAESCALDSLPPMGSVEWPLGPCGLCRFGCESRCHSIPTFPYLICGYVCKDPLPPTPTAANESDDTARQATVDDGSDVIPTQCGPSCGWNCELHCVFLDWWPWVGCTQICKGSAGPVNG